jgi:hypothetical protein
MTMAHTTRAGNRLQGRCLGDRPYAAAPRWILYLVVGSLVIIYLWTLAAISDNVSNLEPGFRAFRWFLLLAALGWVYAIRAHDSRRPDVEVARSSENRNVKAVRS